MALSKQSQGQERAISFPIDAKVEGQEPSLSVLYTAGQRPAEEDIQRILAKADLASLGREVAPDDHRLDVLAGGLTFEMEGVSPGAPADLPAARHFFGMVDTRESFPFEAITLAPAGEAAGLGGGGAVLRWSRSWLTSRRCSRRPLRCVRCAGSRRDRGWTSPIFPG